MVNKNPGNLLEQKKLENELLNKLSQEPNAISFSNAYDQIHNFFLNHGDANTGGQKKAGMIYKKDIDCKVKLFLKNVSNNNTILDVGCGNGFVTKKLSEKNNYTVGLDVSKIALNIAKKNESSFLNLEYICGDARSFSFRDKSFDIIISSDLIEHLPPKDVNNHFSEAQRVLKDKGYYLFWTPHVLHGPASLGLHFKEYTLSEIYKFLENNHFKAYVFFPQFMLAGLMVKLDINKVMFYEKIILNYQIYRFFKFNIIKKLFVPPTFILCQKLL